MTFAQRRNRLTTHFSERIPVVKRRMTVVSDAASECVTVTLKVQVLCPLDFIRTTAARSVTASGATHPTTHHHRTGVSHIKQLRKHRNPHVFWCANCTVRWLLCRYPYLTCKMLCIQT